MEDREKEEERNGGRKRKREMEGEGGRNGRRMIIVTQIYTALHRFFRIIILALVLQFGTSTTPHHAMPVHRLWYTLICVASHEQLMTNIVQHFCYFFLIFDQMIVTSIISISVITFH